MRILTLIGIGTATVISLFGHEESERTEGSSIGDMNKISIDKDNPLYVTYLALSDQKAMMRIADVNLFILQHVRKVLTANEARNLEDMRRDIAGLYEEFLAALKGMEKDGLEIDRLDTIHTQFMEKVQEFYKLLSAYVVGKKEHVKKEMEQGRAAPDMAMREKGKGMNDHSIGNLKQTTMRH